MTLVIVTIGWVLFRAATFGHASDYLAAMFGLGSDGAAPSVVWGEYLPRRSEVLGVVAIASIGYRAARLDRPRNYLSRSRLLLAPLVLALSFMQIVNADFIPLIYFKF